MKLKLIYESIVSRLKESKTPKFKVGDIVKYKGWRATKTLTVVSVEPDGYEPRYTLKWNHTGKEQVEGESSLILAKPKNIKIGK